jgi:hypothetical protein
MTTIKDFYGQYNLIENPFASFTTENESQRFDKTFVKPNDYETILENFSQTNSIILSGDRGAGKTALIKDFINKVDAENTVLVHIIDFSPLKSDYNLNDLYKFLISNLSVSLFTNLAERKTRISNLNREEKLLLCYLLKNFVPQISKGILREKIENIQISWLQRNYKKIENIFRGVFNYGATAGGVFIDEYIAKHFTGLPPLSDSVQIKNFFPELPTSNIEEEFINQETSYQLLLRIAKLSKKLSFNRVLIVFDRADEDSRFMNDAELISDFIVKILTDNKLFLEEDLQVVFSTWSTPFNFIKDQVRTQKHYCPTLSWSNEDLKKALNQRLLAYSDGIVSDYKTLFEDSINELEIENVFEIANNNPRDLWHIFNNLFKVQFESDSNSTKIESESIPKALVKFVTTFNYYEYYPKKSNSRANTMDIYSYTKHLLKLDTEIFTKNQLNEKAQTGGSTINYVIGMERIGLIGLDSQQGGIAQYRIKDSKVIFALKNGLEINKT